MKRNHLIILFSVLLIISFFLDKYVSNFFENFFSGILLLVMYVISHTLFFVVYGLICSYIISEKKKLLHFWAGIVFAYISSILLKFIIGRDRPFGGTELILSKFSLYSFPSSHATVFFFIFAFMTAHFENKTKNKNKKNNYKFYFLIVALLVGFSRVYLGFHYLSDVIGGALLGVGVYYLSEKWIKTLN